MASRILLAALIAASSASALAAVEPDPTEASPAAQVATGAAKSRPARPRTVAILPPSRPDTLDAEAAVPVAAETKAQVSADSASAATPAPSAETAPAAIVVATLPPERPAFPSDRAALEATTQPELALRPTGGQPDALAPEPEAVPAGKVVQVLPPERPAFAADAQAPDAVAEAQPPAPQSAAPSLFAALFGPRAAPAAPAEPEIVTGRPELDAMIAQHAKLNGVPASLVHRIVVRESKYNPRAVGRGGAMGLMQIKTGTARALGYDGGPSGLLDAETNLTYAVKYLAGAYRTARGNVDLAVRHYARGYYYEAKRQGLVRTASRRDPDGSLREAAASTTLETAPVGR